MTQFIIETNESLWEVFCNIRKWKQEEEQQIWPSKTPDIDVFDGNYTYSTMSFEGGNRSDLTMFGRLTNNQICIDWLVTDLKYVSSKIRETYKVINEYKD